MTATAPEFWFCLTHHTVEGEDGCRNADRLGPYASAEEASHALEKVEERNEEWDNDPAWNDEAASGSSDSSDSTTGIDLGLDSGDAAPEA